MLFQKMLEVTCNDRLGKKVRVKCNPDDTVGDLKKLIAAQTGTRYDKIVLKKWYTVFKDHIKLSDCILFNCLYLSSQKINVFTMQLFSNVSNILIIGKNKTVMTYFKLFTTIGKWKNRSSTIGFWNIAPNPFRY